MDEAAKNHEPYTLEMRLRNGNTGEYRWFLDKGTPKYIGEELKGFIGTSLDIHERKEMEKELEKKVTIRTKELLEKNRQLNEAQQIAKLGNWEWDFVNNTVTWSDEMYRIYGYNGETFPVTFEKATERMLPEDAKATSERVRKYAADAIRNYNLTGNLEYENPVFEYTILLPDGSKKILRGVGKIIMEENGTASKMVGTVQDVTEQLRQVKELKAAQESDKLKSDFIKMASHELKTPVTSIKGFVQLLSTMINEADEKDLPPLMIKSSLVSIERQVNRLTRLMSELLDLSRLESGLFELNREVHSLNELMIDIVQDVLYTGPKQHINLYHEFECKISCDKDRLSQAVMNLLMNAIKYSPDADKVDVTIFKHSENVVGISIQDYGIGIDKKDHEKIFERFYRVQGKTELTYQGFGIGLYIAREIIQMHEGNIEVKSEKGKGSTFTFMIPLQDKK
jgi:signal transduction histidine kinase